MQQTFAKDDVKLESQQRAYNGFFKIDRFELQHKLFQGGWSKTFVRELFERGESAAVLLYDPKRDQVVMIEQFRIGAIKEASPWLTEIVAGVVDKDETPAEAAHRETMEESGCTITKLYPIYQYFPSPGGSCEKIHLFCGIVDADGIDGAIYGVNGENENMRITVKSTEAAWQSLKNGQIRDAASIIGLQWLKINYEEVRAETMA